MVTKKKNYVSPCIKVTQIEVESSFAAGSLLDEKKSEIISSGQEVGNEIDASSADQESFWNDGWN